MSKGSPMKLNNETKIGILIVATLVLLLMLTFKAGDFHFAEKGYPIKVHFKQIDGVELNAPVRFNGLEIGQVKDIQILYDDQVTRMELTLSLQEKAKIRQGAKAYVKNMGLLGEKYVGLTDGTSGAAFLEPGAVIDGEEPVDLERLLVKGEQIGNNLNEISANINERLKVNSEHIDEIMKNLDASAKRMASITANVDQRLAINSGAIDETMANMNLLSKNLADFSEDLKKNPWKLLYRQKEKSPALGQPKKSKGP